MSLPYIFIVNFENLQYIKLQVLWLTLNMYLQN